MWDKWRLGRTDYILSLIVIVLGLCLSMYLHDYCNAHYNPICIKEVHYSLSEILWCIVFMSCFAVFGIYVLAMLFIFYIHDSYTIYPLLLFIPLAVFYIVQTFRRCYDSGTSLWYILIPMFPPIVLSYSESKQRKDGERKSFSIERKGLIVLVAIFMLATIWFYGTNISRNNSVATMDNAVFQFHHEPANAVYHWKTVLKPSSDEIHFMKNHSIKRMYVKFFDVSTDNLYDGQGEQPVPVATTIITDQIKTFDDYGLDVEIVPVVFITVEALRLDKPLGERIVQRVDDMCRANSIKYKEIQLDCDWTKETKHMFFSLCQEVKQMLHEKELGLSATIRLHQLRDTLPDIDYGVLMLYNTENLRDHKVKNSILNSQVVREYMRHARSDKHLDFAYPTYEWTLWFKGNKFMGILTQSDTARHEGILRHETSDFTEIMKAKNAIKQDLKDIDYPSSTIIYHLDSANLSKYSNDEIEKIYSR